MRLIDADAFKEYLKNAFEEVKHVYTDGGVFAWRITEDFCRDIDEQPTINAEPHWIPCSERLPDEHEWLGTKEFGTTISDEVYVTFETPKGERFCKHLSFQNGNLSDYDQRTIDVFYKGSKPIAWMPLPEPFRPREE